MKKNKSILLIRLFLIALMVGVFGCINENIEELELDTDMPELMESEGIDGANLRVDPAAQNKLLASVRNATAKYHRIEAALADGYAPRGDCMEGLGIHYVKEDLLNGEIIPTQPEVLLYEPMKNGQLRLVGVAFIVVASQAAATPSFGNVELELHEPHTNGHHHHHFDFPHYQIHVWVWKNNPLGLYETHNPNVVCE
jgi:hypothetical protein